GTRSHCQCLQVLPSVRQRSKAFTPKRGRRSYLLSQSEILDKAATEDWNKTVREALSKHGGTLVTADTIKVLVGPTPQRVGVTEFTSPEKAQAWLDSQERKDLASKPDKAIKVTSLILVEGH